MAPKRNARRSTTRGPTNPPNDETPNIAQLISEQLAAAIPTIVTQISENLRNERTNGEEINGPNTVITRQGCSYKSFMACKPKEFQGTEGAVGVLRWIEKMESVLDISDCLESCRVKYASCSFQDKALTWWNTQVQARGRETANQMTWDELKTLMIEEYCPKNEMQKLESELWNLTMIGAEHTTYTNRFHELARLVPHLVTPETKRIDRYIWGLAPQIRGMVRATDPATLQSAILLAGILTDEMLRTGTLVKESTGEKRKFQETAEERTEQWTDKRQNVIRNFGATIPVATTQERKPYGGTAPKCDKCPYHHVGTCHRCEKCKKIGHEAKDCRGNNYQRACYECGSYNHIRSGCPKLNQEANGNQARGRVFVIGANDARHDPNV